MTAMNHPLTAPNENAAAVALMKFQKSATNVTMNE
jgi:hypothetical protein